MGREGLNKVLFIHVFIHLFILTWSFGLDSERGLGPHQENKEKNIAGRRFEFSVFTSSFKSK